MVLRIAAIVFIFLCTSAAWLILGGTIVHRTETADERLKDRVASTWGGTHVQQPASASFDQIIKRPEERIVDGKKVVTVNEHTLTTPLKLTRTRARATLSLDPRQKGLLWYSTYGVEFLGEYSFTNHSDAAQLVKFTIPLPAKQATYDALTVSVDGKALEPAYTASAATVSADVAAGKASTVQISYRSRGLDRWEYNFGENVSGVRDFELLVRTNFDGFDFPDSTLSPTQKTQTGTGWELKWEYSNLVSGVPIVLAMPQKLQPGPLAGQISFFAPVSLFFFFFLMFVITTLRGIDLHPMNYFFLAAAFFAFHLLLAYLVDHISIHWAFLICSAVSIFLVVSYLRLVVGLRFAAVEAGMTQFIYLVLFSYAFFFEGFTGLAITIGAILTLFVVMQLTGRIRWEEQFNRKSVHA